MTQWHRKSKRKPTGGISLSNKKRDKRKSEKGGNPANTTIGEQKLKKIKGRGKTFKRKLYSTKTGLLADKGKQTKVEILSVVENKANRQYARRNIITKGAVLKVKLGDKEIEAKVTNRPGQTGTIQMVPLK